MQLIQHKCMKRCTVTFIFQKVLRQQNSGAVEDFILPYSAVCQSIFTKVIVKIKVAPFYGRWCMSRTKREFSGSVYLVVFCKLAPTTTWWRENLDIWSQIFLQLDACKEMQKLFSGWVNLAVSSKSVSELRTIYYTLSRHWKFSYLSENIGVCRHGHNITVTDIRSWQSSKWKQSS